MAYFTPLREETLADQQLYLEERLVEVTCLECAACVRVRKNSEFHTSIQWSTEAVERCTEFARRAAERGGRHLRESCPRLRASIEAAVKTGRVPMGDRDG